MGNAEKAASFIDRDTKHSLKRGGCRARKGIIYGNFGLEFKIRNDEKKIDQKK